jgi:NAD(P)-dependent dehydrogenase (short-subunit alcohol dehydrogenase family)
MPTADRVVLITGATGVLGRETARVFAADGARLGLVGTDGDRLRNVASELGLAYDRWMPAVGDLRQRDGARAAVETVTAAFERVDVLIHLVGGYAAGTPIAELDPADVTEMLDQHLWTTLHLAQAVIPGMVERGWGRVLAVSPPVAAEPPAKMAPYAIGKAAQEVLLRTLAKEVAGAGVTVNLVIVKAIDTEGVRSTDPKKASWTAPDEIAATFLFLASDEAAAVTGARIPLNNRA